MSDDTINKDSLSDAQENNKGEQAARRVGEKAGEKTARKVGNKVAGGIKNAVNAAKRAANTAGEAGTGTAGTGAGGTGSVGTGTAGSGTSEIGTTGTTAAGSGTAGSGASSGAAGTGTAGQAGAGATGSTATATTTAGTGTSTAGEITALTGGGSITNAAVGGTEVIASGGGAALGTSGAEIGAPVVLGEAATAGTATITTGAAGGTVAGTATATTVGAGSFAVILASIAAILILIVAIVIIVIYEESPKMITDTENNVSILWMDYDKQVNQMLGLPDDWGRVYYEYIWGNKSEENIDSLTNDADIACKVQKAMIQKALIYAYENKKNEAAQNAEVAGYDKALTLQSFPSVYETVFNKNLNYGDLIAILEMVSTISDSEERTYNKSSYTKALLSDSFTDALFNIYYEKQCEEQAEKYIIVEKWRKEKRDMAGRVIVEEALVDSIKYRKELTPEKPLTLKKEEETDYKLKTYEVEELEPVYYYSVTVEPYTRSGLFRIFGIDPYTDYPGYYNGYSYFNKLKDLLTTYTIYAQNVDLHLSANTKWDLTDKNAWTASDIVSELIDTDIRNDVPQLFQNDYPVTWKPEGSISGCYVPREGCFFTCVSMLCSYFSGENVTPEELASIKEYKKFVTRTGNMDIEGPRTMITDYGGTVANYYREEYDYKKLVKELADGNVCIVKLDKSSQYTASTHYIVIKGLTTKGDFIVNDPNRKNYDKYGEIYSAESVSLGAVYMYSFQ